MELKTAGWWKYVAKVYTIILKTCSLAAVKKKGFFRSQPTP
jgi:hypothetical protein